MPPEGDRGVRVISPGVFLGKARLASAPAPEQLPDPSGLFAASADLSRLANRPECVQVISLLVEAAQRSKAWVGVSLTYMLHNVVMHSGKTIPIPPEVDVERLQRWLRGQGLKHKIVNLLTFGLYGPLTGKPPDWVLNLPLRIPPSSIVEVARPQLKEEFNRFTHALWLMVELGLLDHDEHGGEPVFFPTERFVGLVARHDGTPP